MHADFNTGTKVYAVRQLNQAGDVLAEMDVEATNSEAAAKQLDRVDEDTVRIAVCLNGQTMNDMHVDHWRKRVRRG